MSRIYGCIRLEWSNEIVPGIIKKIIRLVSRVVKAKNIREMTSKLYFEGVIVFNFQHLDLPLKTLTNDRVEQLGIKMGILLSFF